ncbi:MAG: phosphodiester glycosidase family protein [Eubacterium sp.]
MKSFNPNDPHAHCPPDNEGKFPPFIPEPPCDYKPKYPPIRPVAPICEGETETEMLNEMGRKVNMCIHAYNKVMAECYKTLDNLQNAALENGAYYHKPAVWIEEGYSADDGSVYNIIHKSCVDERNEPIHMELKLAYDNTTNSMIEMGISDASRVEYADKIIPAIPLTGEGWYGKAYYKGAPIATQDKAGYYTMGFTKSGVMKAYSNAISNSQLESDGIENAIGCSGVLVRDRQETSGADIANIPEYGNKVSRVVIGQNYTTREVFILTTQKSDEVNHQGMLASTCAQILINYGCDIAVEVCEGAHTAALDKGIPMVEPTGAETDKFYAYWLITRKRFYADDYTYELSELTQNFGATLRKETKNSSAIAILQSELDTAKARIEVNEGSIARITETITTIGASISSITNTLNEQAQVISEINTHATEIVALIDSIQANITTIQGNINAINGEIAGIKDGSTTLPYLKLDGGTVNGNTTFASGISTPVEATQKNDVVNVTTLRKIFSPAYGEYDDAEHGWKAYVKFTGGSLFVRIVPYQPSGTSANQSFAFAINGTSDPVAKAINAYVSLFGKTSFVDVGTSTGFIWFCNDTNGGTVPTVRFAKLSDGDFTLYGASTVTTHTDNIIGCAPIIPE